MATSKAKKAAKLSDSLDELEAKLEPLLSQALLKTSAGLDTLQDAKLHTLLPYLINDLIFIYLKARGVDPKTHEVVGELERVRQYFEKINESETKQQRRTGVDKAAAARFIKHAITQAQQQPIVDHGAEELPAEAGLSTALTIVPVRVTNKMQEREEYLKQVKEDDHSTEEQDTVLEVFDEDTGGGSATPNVDVPNAKSGKKRRKAMDPFTSLEASSSVPASPEEGPCGEEDSASQQKKRRKKKGESKQ